MCCICKHAWEFTKNVPAIFLQELQKQNASFRKGENGVSNIATT